MDLSSRGGNRHTASLESRSITSTAALSTSTMGSDRVSARTTPMSEQWPVNSPPGRLRCSALIALVLGNATFSFARSSPPVGPVRARVGSLVTAPTNPTQTRVRLHFG